MRIWDVHPGYLNRQSLLGEHRELHGIVSILVHGKKGYAHHPETLRWSAYGWALRMRHQLLAAEMALRTYTDKSPVVLSGNRGLWPATYIDAPGQQFALLGEKYRDKAPGRIPLPHNAQQLWQHHKYSVLARDVPLYQELGRRLAHRCSTRDYFQIAAILTEALRRPPTAGGLHNALLHMWGYVAEEAGCGPEVANWTLPQLFQQVQHWALACVQPYLLTSTALSELAVWLEPEATSVLATTPQTKAGINRG